MAVGADVVVIGMGPGGETVAGRLADAGVDVIGIERELVGGECPYWGCIPSKMAIRAANLLAEARRIPGVAGTSTVTSDWAPVAARIRDEATDNWDDRVAVERFVGKGGRFIRGEGRIIARGRVAVADDVIEAGRAIVVATGARAVIPDIAGLAEAGYWTNREALEAKELPASLIVLGGGAVGVELGQAFARFGVEVTILESAGRVLPKAEPEVGDIVRDVLLRDGIAIRCGSTAQHVTRTPSGVDVTLADGSIVHADQLLVSVGRRPDPAAVGLDTVGVPAGARAAPVDDHLRVAPGVWALGDVTGKGGFTHVAVYQAPIVVAAILGHEHAPADYRALPKVTFTDPEIGEVGLTVAAAGAAGIEVRVGRASVPSSARGWIHKVGNEGIVILVADARHDVLVGATALGPNGGEVLGLLTLAVHAEVPLSTLRTMMYAYPTFHRAVEDALRDLDAS